MRRKSIVCSVLILLILYCLFCEVMTYQDLEQIKHSQTLVEYKGYPINGLVLYEYQVGTWTDTEKSGVITKSLVVYPDKYGVIRIGRYRFQKEFKSFSTIHENITEVGMNIELLTLLGVLNILVRQKSDKFKELLDKGGRKWYNISIKKNT